MVKGSRVGRVGRVHLGLVLRESTSLASRAKRRAPRKLVPELPDKASEFGIARMCELARQRGGVCLSPRHCDPNKALRWRCARGHVWRAHEVLVVAGKWCPRSVE